MGSIADRNVVVRRIPVVSLDNTLGNYNFTKPKIRTNLHVDLPRRNRLGGFVLAAPGLDETNTLLIFRTYFMYATVTTNVLDV